MDFDSYPPITTFNHFFRKHLSPQHVLGAVLSTGNATPNKTRVFKVPALLWVPTTDSEGWDGEV